MIPHLFAARFFDKKIETQNCLNCDLFKNNSRLKICQSQDLSFLFSISIFYETKQMRLMPYVLDILFKVLDFQNQEKLKFSKLFITYFLNS